MPLSVHAWFYTKALFTGNMVQGSLFAGHCSSYASLEKNVFMTLVRDDKETCSKGLTSMGGWGGRGGCSRRKRLSSTLNTRGWVRIYSQPSGDGKLLRENIRSNSDSEEMDVERSEVGLVMLMPQRGSGMGASVSSQKNGFSKNQLKTRTLGNTVTQLPRTGAWPQLGQGEGSADCCRFGQGSASLPVFFFSPNLGYFLFPIVFPVWLPFI